MTRSIIAAITTADRFIADGMLRAGRFLTHTGASEGEKIFWHIGAAIALIGGIVALFGEITGGLSVLHSAQKPGIALIASGGLRLARIYLLYKFIMGMAHALKEPFINRKPPQ